MGSTNALYPRTKCITALGGGVLGKMYGSPSTFFLKRAVKGHKTPI